MGGLNPKLQSIMDYDLWLRFATSNRYFHRIPTIVSKYRIHSNSKTAALRQTTYTEIFRLFSSKNHKIPYPWLEGAVNECIVSPLLNGKHLGSLPVRLGTKALCKGLWLACFFPQVQLTIPKFFKPPKHDSLGFTRSYIKPKTKSPKSNFWPLF